MMRVRLKVELVGAAGRRAVMAATLVLAGILPQAGPAHAQNSGNQPEKLVVPNFWDPRARMERPDASDIGGIRFLTTEDFPPFSFRDRRGVLIGFNIDLIDALCNVLKVECALQFRPFESLYATLIAGGGDAVIAGLNAGDAGPDVVATNPYMKLPARFVTRRGATFNPHDSSGGDFLGTVCGSTHAAFVTRFFSDWRVGCYSSLAAALGELNQGRIIAVFGDALRAAFWLHGEMSGNCCAFAGGPYLDDRYFGPGLSIVVRKADRRLKTALDYALREVYRSGKYEELYLRYFPVSLY
jgi:polar amino acid transport system substrate-binding protein